MPVCDPGSLPGFVDTVTTVSGRGSPAEWSRLKPALPRSPTSSTRRLRRRVLALDPYSVLLPLTAKDRGSRKRCAILKHMLKPSAQQGVDTRARMVEAALTTLKSEGFAGTTARAIATRGGFNQALVFYHFGSVKDLLLAALDATSAARMERYEQAVAAASSPEDLLRVAREVYREDLESGHITVLAEMIAGSLNDPDLGPAITARMEPWIDFAQNAIDRVLSQTPLEGLFPTRDLAFALVSFYIGADLLTALDGDRSRAESLFAMADRFLPLMTPLLNA